MTIFMYLLTEDKEHLYHESFSYRIFITINHLSRISECKLLIVCEKLFIFNHIVNQNALHPCHRFGGYFKGPVSDQHKQR